MNLPVELHAAMYASNNKDFDRLEFPTSKIPENLTEVFIGGQRKEIKFSVNNGMPKTRARISGLIEFLKGAAKPVKIKIDENRVLSLSFPEIPLFTIDDDDDDGVTPLPSVLILSELPVAKTTHFGSSNREPRNRKGINNSRLRQEQREALVLAAVKTEHESLGYEVRDFTDENIKNIPHYDFGVFVKGTDVLVHAYDAKSLKGMSWPEYQKALELHAQSIPYTLVNEKWKMDVTPDLAYRYTGVRF